MVVDLILVWLKVGNTRVKLGFGKSMPTNCVWLHGVADTVAEKFLARHMSRFGHVSYAAVDRERCNGLVFYDQVNYHLLSFCYIILKRIAMLLT